MLKAKRKIILISFIVLIALYIGALLQYDPPTDNVNLHVIINNSSNKIIGGIYLYFKGLGGNMKVPDIPQNRRCELKIDTYNHIGIQETSLWLKSIDKESKSHEEKILDYLHCGTGGLLRINITSINEKGQIVYQVEQISSIWSRIYYDFKTRNEYLMDMLLNRQVMNENLKYGTDF